MNQQRTVALVILAMTIAVLMYVLAGCQPSTSSQQPQYQQQGTPYSLDQQACEDAGSYWENGNCIVNGIMW